MTTYTMTDHKNTAQEPPSRDLVRMEGQQAVRSGKAPPSSEPLPEKYRCLQDPEPQAQLQAALRQIETLLHENAQLRKTVLLFSRSMNDADLLSLEDQSISRADRVRVHFLRDLHNGNAQLR